MKDVAKCWITSGQRNVGGGERRLFDNTTLGEVDTFYSL